MERSSIVKSCTVCILLLLIPFKGYACTLVDSTRTIYPYLDDILDYYVAYNMKGPDNIQDLKVFANDLKDAFPDEIHFYPLLLSTTFPLLEKQEKELIFLNTQDRFILKGKDLYFKSERLPCGFDMNKVYPEERLSTASALLRFKWYAFNNKRKCIFQKTELKKEFWQEMKEVYIRNQIDFHHNINNIILLEYRKGGRLCYYCNGKVVVPNSYFIDMEKTIKAFCRKHRIKRLVFHTLQK